MARIKKLSVLEARKIAAGEVIERPVNVVKELVENSIDAQANVITISVLDGGKQQIRIVDNGYGMSQEDAQECFTHHATSKIISVDDLQQLKTFGFRGEALTSIAAVSKVLLKTKESQAHHGVSVTYSQTTLEHCRPDACNTGTDITVNDLFFNIPARRKFLKEYTTELRAIQMLFQAFCFSHLHIHFRFYSQNNELYNCPQVKTIQQRLESLWSQKETQGMVLLVQHNHAKVTITGMISDHMTYRYDRSHQYIFVNNRWVKNVKLSNALMKGYNNVLPQGRYPSAIIHIKVDPADIDINIHPKKQEVAFKNPRIVEQELQSIVKKTLEQQIGAAQAIPKNIEQISAVNVSSYPFFTNKKEDSFFQFNFAKTMPSAVIDSVQQESVLANTYEPATVVREALAQQLQEKQQTFVKQELYPRICGQLKKTYILAEDEQGLLIIDQHAAHERILYERFRKRFEGVERIPLTQPAVVELSAAEYPLVTDNAAVFERFGIEFEPFGQHMLKIVTMPHGIQILTPDELCKLIIGILVEQIEIDDAMHKMLHEKIHAQMACKAAVKAGDILSHEQMEALIKELFVIDNRFTCPHGRPTWWPIGVYEIEKKVKRKS